MSNDAQDDLIPEDSGPVVRLTGRAFEAASGGGCCFSCPKHDDPRAWCPVRAEHRAGRSPMCRYGFALLQASKEAAT